LTGYLDEAVGETRLVRTDKAGRLAELVIERESERGTLARLGEVHLARIARIEPRLAGAFVDLGVGPDGFLPFRRGKTPAGLHEGARIKVEVAAEAAPGKGPRLRRLPDAAESGRAPRLVSEPPPLGQQAGDAIRGPEARRIADEAQEASLTREVALAGGGVIAIETTRALTAIDVDAGAREARTQARLARAVNLAAIEAAARHVGLRALSGLVVIDLLHSGAREDRDAARERMVARLAAAGVKADVGAVSRFGLLELAVERRRRAIHEIALGSDGSPSPETVALMALRRLEDEAIADRGARLVLTAPSAAAAWLESGRIAWREALTARIGARFTLEAWPDPVASTIEARAL
jgi:Ribonuclease G/E